LTTPGPLPQVALVHDYFVQDGGAEAVALELARMFPEALVHTTYFEHARFGGRLDPQRVRPWRLQRVFRPSPWFRPLLPAYIANFSRLEIPASRLVLSNSSTFARGVRARRPAIHVAYVHTPLRFAWDVDGYLARSSFPVPARAGLRLAAPALRRWDRWAGRRADVLVANSLNIQRQIHSAWGRESSIVYPPVNVASVRLATSDEGYYLVASRLLAYKRVDLAVQACARLGRELIVVGDGPERARLQRIAGPRTRFEGHVSRQRLDQLLNGCHAVITPGIEDFGMTTVEGMAVGKPVIAFGAGGALETVIDGGTGILFGPATIDALAVAIEQFETTNFVPAVARERAMEFDVSVFRTRWSTILGELGLGDLAQFASANGPQA
jgi:glycosyltransferase involved in cell wall biosynthesis